MSPTPKSLSETLLSSNPEFNSMENFKRSMSSSMMGEELDLISDPTIRSFVCAVLSRADPFWFSPASFVEGSHPPDEMKIKGLLLHTKRVVRTVQLLINTIESSQSERDCVVAAAILHDVTKALWHRDEITHDPMHMYTVNSFIEFCFEKDTQDADSSIDNVMDIDSENLLLILRLIRCSHGEFSPIPETIPITWLEHVIHMADLISSSLHMIIDGEDILEQRWNIVPIV